jgi:hypothetical protein
MSTISIQQQQNDRRTGIISTVVLHVLLVLLFLFFGLSQPNPLPEEMGIELAFEDAGGLTGGSPDPTPGSPQETATPVTAPETPEEVATDDNSEVEVTKPVKPTPKPAEPKPPKPNPNALFNPSTNPSTNPTTGPPGGGPPGEKPGEGGVGNFHGKGFEGKLAGRGLMRGPSISEKPTEGGKVALDIFVDRTGKVTRVAFNLDRSTTTSQVLFNLAKKAALQCTFSAKPDGAAEQKGEMTFVFILE